MFPNVEQLMENLGKVTDFILQQEGRQQLIPKLIPTQNDQLFVELDSGFWRVFEFVDGSSLDRPENAVQAYQAAQGYGKFLRALDQFPIQELHVTIPNFHNMNFRLRQFKNALNTAEKDRLRQASDQISFVKERGNEMSKMYELASSGLIPLRATHNDTKFNNVLLSSDGESTVIDLDTVMPGYSFYDVGDGLRSAAITSDEDEPDLSNIELNSEFYQAFLSGYLDATADILTSKEKELLQKSGQYMAFIMGVRFLTDFLNGDIYYKTKYADHNLVRAKNQLHVNQLFAEYIR